MTNEPRFYTPQEAARLLGVHVQTVLRAIASDQLPALVIGGPKRHTYRIPADALRDYNRRPVGRPPGVVPRPGPTRTWTTRKGNEE